MAEVGRVVQTGRVGSNGRAALEICAPSIDVRPPSKRRLKVYAFDPSMGGAVGNDFTLSVRYERLEPGPVGERFAVVDYDGSTKTYYAPVDLDAPNILLCDGLDPTESDPRFHQQMVYAVASETLERFEVALGRRVHWHPPPRGADGKRRKAPDRLYLYPHAMVQANAFYSRDAQGILFGYFRAGDYGDAAAYPGQTVFTCLSHDIIVHEVTHAVIDGIRGYFGEPTNIDVPAFHEAFADLAALFRHFSHREVLLDTLQRTGGRLYTSRLRADADAAGAPAQIQAELTPTNPITQLAQQFGQVSGLHGGLRSMIGTPPNAQDIRTTVEPHTRGAILVAAVFDAYFTVYVRRTARYWRLFRAGGGPPEPVDLPTSLAELLAAEASRIADMFFLICARAIDYCPPIDVTFGDFLRAVITADVDLYPRDTFGVRAALMQSFRARGIVPEDAQFFSEDALRWPQVRSPGLPGALPAVKGLVFGDPNGLTKDEKDHNGDILRAYAVANASILGFDASVEIEVPSFHPMFRTDEDGSLQVDMVVEMLQRHDVPLDAADLALGVLPIRSGVTLMIAQQGQRSGVRSDPVVRYVIAKHRSVEREQQQRNAYAVLGIDALAPSDGGRFKTAPQIKFNLLHVL